MHAAVLAGFPDAEARPEGRILWRLDQRGHERHLFVVSPERPDFTHLIEQAGWPTTDTWDTRVYGGFIAGILPGQRWAFRLTANPTRSVPNTAPGRRGTVQALLDEPNQRAWLERQAERNGFRILERETDRGAIPSLIVRGSETVSFARQNAKVTITRATFDGILEAVDVDRFRTALTHGIGRAKGYGCGLLTLAPLVAASSTAD